jgi:hypothetical protein
MSASAPAASKPARPDPIERGSKDFCETGSGDAGSCGGGL